MCLSAMVTLGRPFELNSNSSAQHKSAATHQSIPSIRRTRTRRSLPGHGTARTFSAATIAASPLCFDTIMPPFVTVILIVEAFLPTADISCVARQPANDLSMH
jgi:hypothetical protein